MEPFQYAVQRSVWRFFIQALFKKPPAEKTLEKPCENR